MLEWRLYRVGLLLALAAAAVLMFSVISTPQPLRSDVATETFDGGHAAILDHKLLAVARNRLPGSRDDARAARFVAAQFRAIRRGSVSVQSFTSSFDGHDLQMRNVSFVLPGHSDRRIVIVAPRDCGRGPCAASSGAATGALLELADEFDRAQHVKTLVFVSTDGSVVGAAGAKVLAGQLRLAPAEAVIVLSQPGSALRRRPFVVPWSDGPQSASIQLLESARAAVGSQVAGDPLSLSTFSSLIHLAIPSGLEEQAVLIDRGIDAIGISSAGDNPLPRSEDGLGSLDVTALGGFGRAAQSLVFALDGLSVPLEHGPDAYLPLAGKLIPGWAIALLAIALLAPVGMVSIDGLIGAARAGEPVSRPVLWALAKSIPFLSVLALAYLMSLVGLIPRPAYPFDPGTHTPGVGGGLVLLALTAAFALVVVAIRPLAPPTVAAQALTPAIGLVIFGATAAIWAGNPYLALLLVPTAHLWLAAALPELRGIVIPALFALLLGLALPVVAVVTLGSSLGVGLEVPWQLVLMCTGGHFGLLLLVPLCILGGCLVAIVELTIGRRPGEAPSRPVASRRLGRHAGPGALGGPPSASVPGHKF